MSITRVNFGGGAVGPSNLLCTPPAGVQANDLLLTVINNKHVAPNTPTVESADPAETTPWVLSSNGQASGGAGAAGADSGTVFASCFQRVAITSAVGNARCTITGGNVAQANYAAFRSTLVDAGTHTWSVECAAGSDNTVNTAWSVVGDVDPNIQAGDVVIAFSAINSDAQGAGGWSALSLTTPGVTYGTLFDAGAGFSSTGNDIALRYVEAEATAGASSGPPVFTMTASSSAGNQPTGCTVFVRLREVVIATGTASITLDPITVVATGGAPATGTASITLDPITVVGTGVTPNVGAASIILDALTVLALGNTPEPPPPAFDHAAQAVRRLAQQFAVEAAGSGLVGGRAPALSVTPAPAFAVVSAAEEGLDDHGDAAIERLAQVFRFDLVN